MTRTLDGATTATPPSRATAARPATTRVLWLIVRREV
jgi:hypothetical protein